MPSPDPPSPAQAGGVYLALGDSVTFGVGVPRPRESGFVARVAEELETWDPAIAETRLFAVPGETARGFRDRRLDGVVAEIHELAGRVELVTIGLGANELLRIRRDPACQADRASAECSATVGSALDEAAEALDDVIAAVQGALAAAGSEARVLLLAYYNPDVEPIATSTLVGTDGIVSCDPEDAAPGLNDRIACVAEARDVELVDLYRAFLGREAELTHIGRRDVHPNAAGYGVIAREILETLATDR